MKAFFEEIKQHYGIDIPENEQLGFLITAGTEVHDLRWVLSLHPDQEMVTRSCLHFLGDDAQAWYNEWKKKQEELEKDQEL